MYQGAAVIGEEQLKNLADEIKVGESYPFFLQDENQFCIVLKLNDAQFRRVKGNKQLFVSPAYLYEYGFLVIRIEETPNEEDPILARVQNLPQAKDSIQKSLAKGIEFYFVTENVAEYSIKRLLNSGIGQLALERELEKM